MLPENERLLARFFETRRISPATKISYRTALNSWDRWINIPIERARVNDVKLWNRNAGKLKPSTVLTWATKLRLLSKFLLLERGVKVKMAEMRGDELWEPVPIKDLFKEQNRDKGDRDKVISEDELHSLLSFCTSTMTRAFIAVDYDGAFRKGELKGVKIRDVQMEEKYATAKVTGKTGERTVALYHSLPYLKAWLQVHPFRKPENLLFCSKTGGPLSESYPNASIRYICKRAKIRHIYPHQFRHTRLTEMAKQGVGEFQMKEAAGWSLSSKMPQRYIHLSGRDSVNAVLEAQGIEVPKSQKLKPMLSAGMCPKCDTPIGADMAFCPSCGFILDESLRGETRDLKDQKMEEIMKEIEAIKERLGAQKRD